MRPNITVKRPKITYPLTANYRNLGCCLFHANLRGTPPTVTPPPGNQALFWGLKRNCGGQYPLNKTLGGYPNIPMIVPSWWLQPISKALISQIGSFPQGWKIRNVWNHHLVMNAYNTFINDGQKNIAGETSPLELTNFGPKWSMVKTIPPPKKWPEYHQKPQQRRSALHQQPWSGQQIPFSNGELDWTPYLGGVP